jgi:Na+/H+-translocating membrane pyrophosphatase
MIVLLYFHRRLGFKIFLSYLVINLVGVAVLATTAEMVIPTAFERHMAVMADIMGERIGIPAEELEADLFTSFRAAVMEALALAALSMLLVAAAVSYLISRRVVAQVTEMKNASPLILSASTKRWKG